MKEHDVNGELYTTNYAKLCAICEADNNLLVRRNAFRKEVVHALSFNTYYYSFFSCYLRQVHRRNMGNKFGMERGEKEEGKCSCDH